jgi:hypothetical protein
MPPRPGLVRLAGVAAGRLCLGKPERDIPHEGGTRCRRRREWVIGRRAPEHCPFHHDDDGAAHNDDRAADDHHHVGS